MKFSPRGGRSSVSLELTRIKANNEGKDEDPFIRFGQELDDRLHLIPGEPGTVEDFMVEGLVPETNYAIRIVETITNGVIAEAPVARLCSVTSAAVFVTTGAEIPAQRPYARLMKAEMTKSDKCPVVINPGKNNPLLELAAAAAAALPNIISVPNTEFNGSPESEEQFLQFAIPVLVDEQSTDIMTEEVITAAGPAGDKYAIFPQATPEFAYQQAVEAAVTTERIGTASKEIQDY